MRVLIFCNDITSLSKETVGNENFSRPNKNVSFQNQHRVGHHFPFHFGHPSFIHLPPDNSI